MTFVLRALARLAAFLVLLALAVLSLMVALVVLLPALAEAFGLLALREVTGAYLAALDAPGTVAVASLLAGLCAVLVALLLLIGALAPARDRLVVSDDGQAGRLAARRRALAHVAEALVAGVAGVTAVKAKVRPSRRGRGGRLAVATDHTRSESPDDVRREAEAALAPLAEGFSLKTRVRPRIADAGARVE